jgi:hypothetical protein
MRATFLTQSIILLVCSALISSWGSNTVQAKFVNKGEVNYDVQLRVAGQQQTTVCSNIAPAFYVIFPSR